MQGPVLWARLWLDHRDSRAKATGACPSGVVPGTQTGALTRTVAFCRQSDSSTSDGRPGHASMPLPMLSCLLECHHLSSKHLLSSCGAPGTGETGNPRQIWFLPSQSPGVPRNTCSIPKTLLQYPLLTVKPSLTLPSSKARPFQCSPRIL